MKIRPRTLLVVAIPAATAALAFFFWAPFSPTYTGGRSAPAVASEEERIRALEAGLEALSAQVQALATQTGTRRRGISATPAQSERIDQELSNPQAAKADRDRRFANYDAAFRSEPLDAKWARGAEQKLASVGQTDAILSIEADSPTSRSIECRTRMCRLQFTFANAADAEDWSLAFATGTGNNLKRLQYAVDQLPDGSARVTMFGTR